MGGTDERRGKLQIVNIAWRNADHGSWAPGVIGGGRRQRAPLAAGDPNRLI